MFVEQLPISMLSENEQDVFIKLVDKVLLSKDNSEDSSAFEAELNNLVYELYGLNEEEIRFIQSS